MNKLELAQFLLRTKKGTRGSLNFQSKPTGQLPLHSVAQPWTLSAFNHLSLFYFTSHCTTLSLQSVPVIHLNSDTGRSTHLRIRI